jgi:hypothetical protein
MIQIHPSLSTSWTRTLCISAFVVTANCSAGVTDFDRFGSSNYGYYYENFFGSGSLSATNLQNQPYSQSVEMLGGQNDEGFVEIDVNALSVRSHYYLELSPYSVYAIQEGIPPQNPWSLNVYWSVGDGVVTMDDRGSGQFLERVAISQPGQSWYSSNGLGGYWGDSYADITTLVNNARSNSVQYLSFRYGAINWADDPWTPTFRGLLRTPAVLATDFVVPAPGSIGLLAICGAFRLRRRKQ